MNNNRFDNVREEEVRTNIGEDEVLGDDPPEETEESEEEESDLW